LYSTFVKLKQQQGKMRVLSVSIAAVLSTASAFSNQAFFIGSNNNKGRSTARFSATAEDTAVDYATPERYATDHPNNNVPDHIAALVGRGLHEKENHPLGIINAKIKEYFELQETEHGGPHFDFFLGEDPVVTTTQCFDDLRIEPDHPGRSPSDTYYISDDTLLRTHTSAHQSQHLRDGNECFLCAGDVYRRDEIDSSHYPAFHQLEGVKLFDPEVVGTATGDEWLNSDECKQISDDLKATLEGLMDHLFGPVEKKWSEDYFPFTEPSFECEIMYEGEWLEILGCGVVHTEVLEMAGRSDRRGWAFGLGLERLAMILFKIPDIRLFWTEDQRFHKQFKAGQITAFKPYSKYPPVYKDIAFWIPENFVENDFFEMARGIAGDLVERMELTDEFTNPKKGKTSKCFRITYRSMDRSLTDDEVNQMQDTLREKVEDLGVEVR
jgi:phenylalanyl-tRNA synthetase alpha chain